MLFHFLLSLFWGNYAAESSFPFKFIYIQFFSKVTISSYGQEKSLINFGVLIICLPNNNKCSWNFTAYIVSFGVDSVSSVIILL